MTFSCVVIVLGVHSIVYDFWRLLLLLLKSLNARQYNETLLATRGYVVPSPNHVEIMFQNRLYLNVTARQKVQAHRKQQTHNLWRYYLCCFGVMSLALILLYFAQVAQVLANTYASLHWGHVLLAMFSLLYCFMLQASIGISNHGLTKTNMHTKVSIIAIWDSNVPG